MRTMSACCLTVSLKSVASVMSGGDPAGIVGQKAAKGNIAASLELGNPVDRRKFQLRASENVDEVFLAPTIPARVRPDQPRGESSQQAASCESTTMPGGGARAGLFSREPG